MGKLLLAGGAEGVGKSTLIKSVTDILGVEYIHTGGFFPNYPTKAEAKQAMIAYARSHTPAILDTHYASHVDSRFVPKLERTLFDYELNQLAEGNELGLVLFNLDSANVLKRRSSDNSKKRDLDVWHIGVELDENITNFFEYMNQLKVSGLVILNESYDKARKDFFDYAANFFG